MTPEQIAAGSICGVPLSKVYRREVETRWPPEAVRFRQWDFDRAVWYFRTTVTHRPRNDNSVLTVCGLDWLGSHTVNEAGPATCKKCRREPHDA